MSLKTSPLIVALQTWVVLCLIAVSFVVNAAAVSFDERPWYQIAWHDHIVPSAVDGFDRNGLYLIGGSVAAVATAQPLDYSIRDTWMDHQRMPGSVSSVFDYVGQGYFGISIALGQLFLDRNNGIFHSEALISTFLATSVLKNVNQRLRPDGSDHFSMPSGHSSTTFATATALAYSYGPWIGVPSYLIAAATAASRWSDNRHWFSDTVAGAAVGIFWARAVHFHHFKTVNPESSSTTWMWSPVWEGDMVGAVTTVQF